MSLPRRNQRTEGRAPGHRLSAYQLHLRSFREEFGPKGATEAHLVQAIASTSWCLHRVAALETNVSKYKERLSRQFERTAAQLRDLQSARRAEPNGRVRVKNQIGPLPAGVIPFPGRDDSSK